jgi:hypothetical protein
MVGNRLYSASFLEQVYSFDLFILVFEITGGGKAFPYER